MRRSIFMLLLVLALVCGLTVVTALADETAEASHPHDAANYDHCVCGGSAVNVYDHGCADTTWQPWPEGVTSFGSLSSGNYYLTGDVAITAAGNVGSSSVKKTVSVCLNGYNMTSSTTRVVGYIWNGSVLNFCDCSGAQDAEGNWTWDGTVTAGTGSGKYGGIFYQYYLSTANIYGGNFTGLSTNAINGSVFIVANDKASSTSSAANAAVFNMYNGNVYASVSTTGAGGTIGSFHASQINIHGGTVSGGRAGTAGGNIANSGTNSKMTVTGGTVTGGTAATDGGNIYARNLTVTGGTVTGGTAATAGGNIYVINGGTVTGGTVSGGTATGNGGGICSQSSTLTLSGGTVTGNTAGDNGGNIWAQALTLSGGTVAGGTVTGNPGITVTTSTDESTGETTTTYAYSAQTLGSGGNIYIDDSGSLVMTGGTVYGGVVNGNCGGNIFVYGGTSEITGGKIWGGVVNADNSKSKSAELVNGYDVLGGSVAYWNGTHVIAGTVTIGIDAEGNPAGGTVTAGGEGGNIYVKGVSTNKLTIKGSAVIANGHADTLNASGVAEGKGGNISGGGYLYIQENAVIRDGVARTGGNLTLYNNNRTYIQGGTITGGTAYTGGNITFEGTASSQHTLNITGGTISNGTAEYRGGNLYAPVSSKTVKISGGTVITGGEANSENGLTTYGGNIYSAGPLTVDSATVSGGTACHGGNLYLNSGTVSITNSTISDGKANLMCDGTTNGNGGNILSASSATTTISGCTITGGEARRAGSVGAWGSVTVSDTTVSGGYAYYSGGNIMVYGTGKLTLNAGTVLKNGESGGEGGALSFYANSGMAQAINDGVEIYDGVSGTGTNGIYHGGGTLTVSGAPLIGSMYVSNNSSACVLDVSALTCATPIALSAKQIGTVAVSAADTTACFTVDALYVMYYDGEAGTLVLAYPVVQDVYVSASGDDRASGSEAAPVQTVERALNIVADGGTVHLVGTLELSGWDKHGKSVTVTGGELVAPATRLELQDHVRFTDMTLTLPADSYIIYCNGYTTVFDADMTVRYYDGTDYTTDSTTSTLYGGSRSAYVTANGAITGTDLTVLSGVWGYVYGGNNAGVDMTGDVHLTVGGKINQGIDYVSHTMSSNYLVMGGSRTSNIYGTVYMNVIDGFTGTSTHGGGNGACHIDNIVLTVSGGEGMALYGGGRGGAQTVGTINFYYEGGTFEQVLGGVLSNLLTGDVNLYITGGNVTRRVYGGCYSNCDESTGNWTADNYVTGNVRLIIGSGANISCDLKDPDAGLAGLLTGGKYADRGIYGHSRRAAPSASDAENSAIIFLDYAAYTANKSNLTAQDTIMAAIMNGVSAADVICYLGWSADDTNDVISAGATAVADPETGVTGDASAYGATATLTMDATEYTRYGQALTPAYVVYSDNWVYDEVVLSYANNNAEGTATVTGTVNGYAVTKEFTVVDAPTAAQVIVGGTVQGYYTLQEAIDATPEGGYLKLTASGSDAVTVSKELYLDLAGFSLTGEVTVAEGVTLYGMDSTTNSYDCSNGYGVLANVSGTVALHHKTDVTGRILRYLTYTDPTTGAVSFHRIYLGITKTTLKPGVTGVGYKAVFGGDEKVLELLDADAAFGFGLWLGEDGTKTAVYGTKDAFVTGKEVTLRVENYDIANYGSTALNAEVYLKLADGTVIDSADYSLTLKAMLETVAQNVSAYTEAQMTALKTMCENNAEAMADWDIAQILSWTPDNT